MTEEDYKEVLGKDEHIPQPFHVYEMIALEMFRRFCKGVDEAGLEGDKLIKFHIALALQIKFIYDNDLIFSKTDNMTTKFTVADYSETIQLLTKTPQQMNNISLQFMKGLFKCSFWVSFIDKRCKCPDQ